MRHAAKIAVMSALGWATFAATAYAQVDVGRRAGNWIDDQVKPLWPRLVGVTALIIIIVPAFRKPPVMAAWLFAVIFTGMGVYGSEHLGHFANDLAGRLFGG